MTVRFPVLALAALLAALSLTACGGGDSKASSGSSSPTVDSGPSNGESSAVTGDTSDPKNDAYACVLLDKADIEAAGGSPAQPATHPKATVLQGEALTSCTVKSVADCPQNLTKDAPYCDKAYQVQWSVDVYPSANAAQLTFGNDKRGGPTTAVTIAGADEAVYYSTSGAVEVRKGAGLMRLLYNGPGSLSGNAAVALRVVPEQEAAAETMAGAITKKLP